MHYAHMIVHTPKNEDLKTLLRRSAKDGGSGVEIPHANMTYRDKFSLAGSHAREEFLLKGLNS